MPLLRSWRSHAFAVGYPDQTDAGKTACLADVQRHISSKARIAGGVLTELERTALDRALRSGGEAFPDKSKISYVR